MQIAEPEERKELFSELITLEPEDFFSTSFGSLEKLIVLSKILDVKKIIRHFEFLTKKAWDAYKEEEVINEEVFGEEFRIILSDLVPLLIEEKENENLLFFLMKNKDEIEKLFPFDYLKKFFSDMDSLKKNLMENYKKRGFESVVLKIQQLHETIDR